MNSLMYPNIVNADLDMPLVRRYVGEVMASGDDHANRYGAQLHRNGEEVDASAYQVFGYMIRPNDETIRINGGVDGSTVYVDVPKNGYVYDGAFTLTVKVYGDGFEKAVAMFDGVIARTTSENIIDGDRVVYGVEEILALINDMEAAEDDAEAAAQAANTAAGSANVAAVNANKWADAEAKATPVAAGSQPTVNVTEENGKKVLSFGVPAGVTPDITFKVATGAPGTDVQISQGGTPEAPVVDLTIPRGDTGAVEGLDYYDGNPAALGTASPGTANGVARGNHVHPMPTAEQVGARPDTWMPTAEQVGARPDTWMPTAEQVGALASDGKAQDSFRLNGKSYTAYEKLLSLGVSKIQCGSISKSVAGNSDSSVQVTFPTAMSEAPKAVFATSVVSTPAVQQVGVTSSSTATTMTVTFHNGFTETRTCWAYWLAIWT